ncbi:MAG: methylmalonyl-CoA mutase, partial [Deltaproteobacteria bacterium]|nr:methylmalonyl-CoA mutase [Deltaproteobacteria bacterium]
ILDEVDEIEKMGGYVTAIERGWLHKKIAEYFNNERKMIEKGDIKLVGYNIYKTPIDLPPINVFRYPEGVEDRQKARLKRLREKRNNEKVSSALLALEEACKKGTNVMPYTLQCARVGCSEGEIFKVFKKAFGLWKPPLPW